MAELEHVRTAGLQSACHPLCLVLVWFCCVVLCSPTARAAPSHSSTAQMASRFADNHASFAHDQAPHSSLHPHRHTGNPDAALVSTPTRNDRHHQHHHHQHEHPPHVHAVPPPQNDDDNASFFGLDGEEAGGRRDAGALTTQDLATGGGTAGGEARGGSLAATRLNESLSSTGVALARAREVRLLQHNLGNVRRELVEARHNCDALADRAARSEQRVGELQSELDGLRTERDAAAATTAQSEAEVASLRADVERSAVNYKRELDAARLEVDEASVRAVCWLGVCCTAGVCAVVVLGAVVYSVLCCAVLCCAVLCCAVLCCAVLCCAVLCCTTFLLIKCVRLLAVSLRPLTGPGRRA